MEQIILENWSKMFTLVLSTIMLTLLWVSNFSNALSTQSAGHVTTESRFQGMHPFSLSLSFFLSFFLNFVLSFNVFFLSMITFFLNSVLYFEVFFFSMFSFLCSLFLSSFLTIIFSLFHFAVRFSLSVIYSFLL